MPAQQTIGLMIQQYGAHLPLPLQGNLTLIAAVQGEG